MNSAVPLRSTPRAESQKDFMERLGKSLGFRDMNDWYKITKTDITSHGGAQFLRKHSGNPSKLVQSSFPEHLWHIWKFRRSQFGVDICEKVDYVKGLGKELSIKHLDDWYRVSWKQITERVSVSFLEKNPLEEALPLAYPGHVWDIGRLESRRGRGIRPGVPDESKLIDIAC